MQSNEHYYKKKYGGGGQYLYNLIADELDG